MAVTPARTRKLALSLPETSAKPHFDRVAFRTPRRIFATMANDGSDLNLMFDADLQAFFCAQAPESMAPHPSGWGKRGAVRCDLTAVDEATLLSALKAAHALAAPAKKTAKSAAPAKKRRP